MTYVAWLRGINVGGNNIVDMKALRAVFERAGMSGVRTYINSGNVVFRHASEDADALARVLEDAIDAELGVRTQVLVRSSERIAEIIALLPDDWHEDRVTRCYVFMAPDEVIGPDVMDLLTIVPGVDEVLNIPGAVIWHVARADLARSGMKKLLGTDLYRRMTARNVNTVRKIAEIMSQVQAEE